MHNDRIKMMNARQEQMEKSQQVFAKMKPLLEQELSNRLLSKSAITVAQPIRIIVEMAHKSTTGGQFSFGNAVIPAGSTLFYEGCELDQMYFTDQNGKEYAVHSGVNVTLEKGRIVTNTGYVGLLTNTDIFTTVKNQILGN